MPSTDYGELETALGHTFDEPALLEQALTHRSFANESPDELLDNERLEFLGDAVIGLTIGHELMKRFPDVDEGELSVLRAELVSESGLASAAGDLGLGKWLRLGKGEERSGGRSKSSLLSDALEAVCGAVYLDSDFESARGVVLRLLGDRLERAPAGVRSDYKSQLQERTQAVDKETPRYEVVDTSGPDHDKRFTVRVLVGGEERARATGRSKKAAEQDAARLALEHD